jgi:purine-binding chemotaxis protein CheW
MTRTDLPTPAAPRLALLVRLGETLHALPVESVEEVLPALPIEPIPQAPTYLRGVVFVRGHWIPVVDAAERLGLERPRTAEPPIVCLSLQGRLIGVEVDEALDVIDLSRGVEAAAADLGAGEGFFAGLVDLEGQSIRILNPQRLLAAEEASRLPQGASGHMIGGAS